MPSKQLVSERANQRVKFFRRRIAVLVFPVSSGVRPEVHLISILLNGETREVPSNLNLEALVNWMKVPADRVAIERNLEIVPRRLWSQTVVAAGDRLEIVHFVGGGTSH